MFRACSNAVFRRALPLYAPLHHRGPSFTRIAVRSHSLKPAYAVHTEEEGPASIESLAAASFKAWASEISGEGGQASSASPGPPSGASAPSTETPPTPEPQPIEDLYETTQFTPTEVVAKLDEYIIGQGDAKKAVAIGLRNRWRRQHIPAEMRDDVIPKNILMIGPTGCGKTEIARRLAKLIDAPFIKVEATKFTELGFHGRDVDQIIRDLVEISIKLTRQKIQKRHQKAIDLAVENAVFIALMGDKPSMSRAEWSKLYKEGALDKQTIEIDLPQDVASIPKSFTIPLGGKESKDAGNNEGDNPFITAIIKSMEGRGGRRKKMTVGEARAQLERRERDKMVDNDTVIKAAIRCAEQEGIIFLDEIDKIAMPRDRAYRGPDPSSEGVQRDLLPIIEGSIMNTKYGNVDTSKMLFIASGAFHSCKPSDLLAEFQGRLPIRVELKGLDQRDLHRVLTETKNNQILQNIELLKTEGVELEFTPECVQEIARIAYDLNNQIENLGARRLHGVIEKIVEDVSFNCEKYKGQKVTIDQDKVKQAMKEIARKGDLTRFIL